MDDATFLDVDNSLRIKNLLLQDGNKETLNERMDELMKQLDSKPSILVQPTPGICVKTKTSNGDKVFINVCISDKIPPPKDISDSELFKIIEDELTNYIIPMSIGSERMEADKSGIASATYDVMINSKYLKKCQEKKQFMAFTVLIILSGVENKFNKNFNTEDYVILKNRTVLGKLQQHRIENREIRKPQSNKPLIEEISTISNNRNLLKNDTKMIILREPVNGPARRLIALFDMSTSITIENIVVLINFDRINVTDEKTSCSYDVFLPYILDANGAEAFFDYNIGVLRLDILIGSKRNRDREIDTK